MTRKEIVKALRVCSNGKMNCSKCPMWDSKIDLRCMDFAMKCAADMLEQDANTKSRPSPIPIEEITGTILVTPCWIEIKYGEGYTHITPDILDKDSTGYFGKLYSREGDTTQYLYEKDYNRTWRCWRECPGDETVNNAKWEESQ